jgi:tetratricopeptide (TPR) repeat protein
MLLEQMGLAHMARGDEMCAMDYYRRSLDILNGINALYSQGRVHAHLGNALTKVKQLVEAEEALVQASKLFEDVHMYRGYTLLAFYLANFYREQGHFQEAQRRYTRAIKLFDDVQDRYGQAQSLLEYARLLRVHAHESEALKVASWALAIYRDRGTEKQVEHVQIWIEKK